MSPGRVLQRWSASLQSIACVKTTTPLPLRHRQLPSTVTRRSLSLCKAVTGIPFNRFLNERNSSLPGLASCRRTQVTSAGRREIVQFNLSDIGEGIAEVSIKEWYVTVGQVVSQFDSICEVQSDKASVTITSKFDGVVRRLHHDIDDVARVGQPLVDIEIVAGDGVAGDLVDEIEDLDAAGKSPGHSDSYKKSLATPAVRRIAMENSVDLSLISGSGKDGRVMKEDVLLYLESSRTGKTPAASLPTVNSDELVSPVIQKLQTIPPPGVPAVSFPKVEQDKVVQMSPITKAMFKAMTKSLQIPHLGLGEDVDVGRLLQMKELMKSQGIKFLPFFLKAASIALAEFPILNSCIHDESNGEVLLRADHNIGFACDTPSGLLVPNVKRVQDRSILQISHEIKRMMEDGKNNRARPEDLAGGTFTLSNVGSIGGTFGIPIILTPQVAIGAIGRMRVRPVFAPDDSVIKRHIITVVWSADHRVIDGATIARFSNRWRSLLQQPEQMLLHLK